MGWMTQTMFAEIYDKHLLPIIDLVWIACGLWLFITAFCKCCVYIVQFPYNDILRTKSVEPLSVIFFLREMKVRKHARSCTNFECSKTGWLFITYLTY